MQLQSGVYPIYAEDYARILEVWEASVRATHHFVQEADILFFRPLVQNAIPQITEFACVRDSDGQAAGFVAVEDGKVEMLFVHPSAFGQGGGKRLLKHAIHTFGAWSLDCNEQNEQALAFYLHMGFEVTGRSALDSTGKPYPLLHLRLAGLPEEETLG